MLLGPPLGGALYSRFGFHGPFILTIIITAVDLIARVLIIERKQALLFGVDPAAQRASSSSSEEQVAEIPGPADGPQDEGTPATHIQGEKREGYRENIEYRDAREKTDNLSYKRVFKILLKSPRALTVTYNTLIYGYVQ